MAITLIKETGSQSTTANTWADVDDVTAYAETIGNSVWAEKASEAQKAAIIRAMRYIEGYYRTRWKGRRTLREQALSWPRTGVEDHDGLQIYHNEIPADLVKAVCEGAIREATTPGTLRPDIARNDWSEGSTTTVGPITTSRRFSAAAPVTTTFQVIDDLLRPFLEPAGLRLRRA